MATFGTVYLVGAGPGDPGLLTVKGLECLQRADLVLYDGLVNPLLLRHTNAVVERTARTTVNGGRQVPQEEINERLIAAARAGKTVVRLKGGDPYIFGRGGEEAAALADAGIPFEVVPGITAATAAGAYAGLSLTHRQMASQVMFVTGHEDPAKTQPAIDYRLIAEFRGTLVFYMGLHRLAAIAESLIADGRAKTESCCVISRATLPSQRVVEGTLSDIAKRVESAALHAPSLFVVGDVVSQRETFSWFERLPLFGLRIGITRPSAQADTAIRRCLQLGAESVLMPTIEIHPPDSWDEVDQAIQRLPEFDWLIFSSANGVQFFLERLWETGGDGRRLAETRIACIGPATAEALESYQLRADIIPDVYRAEALAAALRALVAGKRVLWARASRGRDTLPAALLEAGAQFEQVVVYRNIDAESLPADVLRQIEAGEIDWIGLSSPSIARNLPALLTPAALQQVGSTVKLASISPVTTSAAAESGLTISAEASTYTWDGLLDAIARAHSIDEQRSPT